MSTFNILMIIFILYITIFIFTGIIIHVVTDYFDNKNKKKYFIDLFNDEDNLQRYINDSVKYCSSKNLFHHFYCVFNDIKNLTNLNDNQEMIIKILNFNLNRYKKRDILKYFTKIYDQAYIDEILLIYINNHINKYYIKKYLFMFPEKIDKLSKYKQKYYSKKYLLFDKFNLKRYKFLKKYYYMIFRENDYIFLFSNKNNYFYFILKTIYY